MVTAIKRLFWLGLLGGAGFAAWSLWSSSRRSAAAAPAADPVEPAAPATRSVVAPVEPAATTTLEWVVPVDGACPTSHPIKANDNSKIFHVPGGRFYERTKPERCYATPEGAAADGYRAAKS